MSAYLAFTTKYPTLLISPCSEKFDCAHRYQDKLICSEDCKNLQHYRCALDSGMFDMGVLSGVDVEDSYDLSFDFGSYTQGVGYG